jgi:RecJ-like exonuclease
MRYDVRQRTLTLGKKSCPHCTQGKMPTATHCRTCGGNGKGPRGGAGGCHACKGTGVKWDYDTLTFCEVCLGAWQGAADETWDDHVPTQVVTHLPLTVNRVNRANTWNENHAGRGTLLTAFDNGRARGMDDDHLVDEVRQILSASPPKASAVTLDLTGAEVQRRKVIEYAVLTVTRTGFSVRPGGLVTRPAEREPVRVPHLIPIGDPEPGVCDRCHLIHIPGECF